MPSEFVTQVQGKKDGLISDISPGAIIGMSLGVIIGIAIGTLVPLGGHFHTALFNWFLIQFFFLGTQYQMIVTCKIIYNFIL